MTDRCDHYFGPWHFRPAKNYKGAKQYWCKECSKCHWVEEVFEKPTDLPPYSKTEVEYQVRWSYTSDTEPTFGRYLATFKEADNEVKEAHIAGMTYIDIVHPDGRVEIKKGKQ